MSQYATERAIWEATSGPDKIQAYLANPDAFLAQYAMTDEEKALVKAKDVKALADKHGQSHMLLMLFWLVTSGGFAALQEYLGRMNAPA